MACYLFSAMPLSETMLTYCELNPKETKFQWNFNHPIRLSHINHPWSPINCVITIETPLKSPGDQDGLCNVDKKNILFIKTSEF